MLWLPGFEPAGWQGDVAQPEAVKAPQAPELPVEMVQGFKPDTVGFARRPVVAVAKEKAVWTPLDPGLWGDLGGMVAKFDANMQALEVLKALEAEDRYPTEHERTTLTRYTGWGGLPKAFADYRYGGYSEWAGRNASLKEALTEDEYKSAEASTPNAHYTSHEVITAMWSMVEKLGFQGGRVLEPAAGVGYFIGAMPTKMAQKSQVTAIELDTLSSRITKKLYGEFGVKVLNDGFEKIKAPEGFYDLVISNVPFGNYTVNDVDGLYPKMSIHNFFIAKALRLTRVGGLVAVITSSYTLDSASDAHRQEIANLANLVGAVRLPNSAFKEIAGTEVSTDVLIFQRRSEADAADRSWCDGNAVVPAEMKAESAAGFSINTNRYFVKNPEQVIGKLTLTSNGYRQTTVSAKFDGDLAQALAERVAALPSNIMPQRGNTAEVEVSPRTMMMASAEWVKPGAYVIKDGKLCVSVDGHELEMVENTMTTAKATRIRAMIPVRDALRKVLASQASSDDDAMLERYRLSLMAEYEAFTGTFGPLSKPFNKSALRHDPDFPLLLSLEHWDEETQTARKADVFYRRTVGAYRKVQRCETPEEALLVCLSEHAKVVPARIAELLEMEVNAAMSKCLEKGLVFVDPDTEAFVEADAYLSGDVKTKLEVARLAEGDYQGNVDALGKVVPEDVPAHDLAVKLGATWVPVAVYDAFAKHLLDSQGVHVTHEAKAGTYNVKGYAGQIPNRQTFGTSRVDAMSLLELSLNQSTPRVTDPDRNDPEGKKRVVNTAETLAAREKQEAIKEQFLNWLWTDVDRSNRLVEIYNDRFNRIVLREFDGSHLTLPGFSSAYVLREHQANGIWRCVASKDSTLLAHAVGAGKTLTMICAAMEMRRTGLASKPVLVVPNHMLEQVAAEFLRAYPSASVLIASKEDMAPDRRKTLIARMATGDWDAVVLTHSSFERIPMPSGYSKTVIENTIDELEAAWRDAKVERNTRAVKELAKQKKVWQMRLEKKAEGNGKDDMLDFAEIGFDALFVDEFHYFKNLYKHTNLQIPGVATNDSNRAFDMSIKVGYVQQKQNGRGVIAATGTPIANSVAEMWVMQKFLQPRTLERMGLSMFDSWAADFGEAVTAMELAPDGSSYRVHTRFAKFVNVPELLTIFREVADIKTAEMLDLPVPKARFEIVTAEPTPRLQAYVESLVARAEKIRNGKVTPQEDNMLAVTNDGRQAATDMRLVGILEDDEGSKINLVVKHAFQIWQDSAPVRGTQMIFLDMGTPTGGSRCDLYSDMRTKLVKLGVPSEEVAFIHEAGTDKAKEKLFESVRAGRVRILIGSTAKMGVGTNVQTRLVALHHIDGPWRPADVEQREGRIIRQGNTNKEVRILRYVTEGTFDAYVWQTLETKARFIAQVMRGDTGVRSMEDAELSALSFAEVKALASGNPMVIEKASVDAEVMKLSMLKSTWQRQRDRNSYLLATLPAQIRRDDALLQDLRDDQAAARKALKAMNFVIRGVSNSNEEDVGLRIIGAAYMAKPGECKEVGKVGEFGISVEGARNDFSQPSLLIEGKVIYTLPRINKTPRGIVNQIQYILEHEIAEDLVRVEKRVNENRMLAVDLAALREVPFEHEVKLKRLLARKAEIDALLCLTVAEEAAVDVEDGELAKAA